MATWHDTLEEERSEHICYSLSITPEDYEPNGYAYLDSYVRARMIVFLYYGHKEAKTPEERNEYKRIYCKWHPQSYSFRNINLQEYRNIRIQDDDSDDEVDLPPLISYDSDDETDLTPASNTNSTPYTSARYTNIPDTLNHIDENPVETMCIDTNMGTRVNYYSKRAIEIAQAVKVIQGKLGKFSLRKVHEAILNGSVIIPESFTRAQVITADEILGTDIEYKQGVYTEKKQN
jgi:hypothetical protein